MKIYRVAETQKKIENAYVEVDDRDLSKDSDSWTTEKKIEEINISIVGYDRQSLIRIVFSEKDIVALYKGLFKGWQEKIEEYEELKTYKRFLDSLIWKLKFYQFDSENLENSRKVERIKKTISDVEAFTKKLLEEEENR